MRKIRRVDFYPDEFLVGTTSLTLEEAGAYWKVCSLIYSRGVPIDDDDRWIANAITTDVRKWRQIKARLLSKGKLRVFDGRLTNDRCELELSRTHQRIEDAQRNGALGGRPPKRSPGEVGEMSARCPGDPPTDVGTSPGDVHNISPPELNGINDITKAAGFSGENLTNNHQPTNLPKKELPPQRYVFEGKIIRLTLADLSRWKETYHAIPDLLAELKSYDAWFDASVTDPAERAKWFHRTRQRLNKLHQDWLAKRQQPTRQAAI